MHSILFLCLVFLVSFDVRAAAGNEPCSRTYEVGFSDYAPIFIREKGQRSGIAIDLARELSRRTGCIFSENEFTRPAAISRMRQGKMDLFFMAGSKFEFDNIGVFVPLYEAERSLTYLRSLKKNYDSIQDLLNDKKMRVGVMIGSHSMWTPEELASLNAEGRTVGAPNPEGLFRMLKNGRVQAVLFSTGTTLYYIDKLKMTGITERLVDRKTKTQVGYVYSTRRMSSRDVELITGTMKVMEADGTLKKIYSKYLTPNSVEFRQY
ncbi:substrate-binding periplasmic protein [Bdellovibrio sp. HCB274]|uniref:substrate-binding periplasmic protein n=1 Tax=Bdellovibrio sp. HCB274 TaxID=3394361 RepID=UPI0039B5FF63